MPSLLKSATMGALKKRQTKGKGGKKSGKKKRGKKGKLLKRTRTAASSGMSALRKRTLLNRIRSMRMVGANPFAATIRRREETAAERKQRLFAMVAHAEPPSVLHGLFHLAKGGLAMGADGESRVTCVCMYMCMCAWCSGYCCPSVLNCHALVLDTPPKSIDNLPRTFDAAMEWICQRFGASRAELYFQDPTSLALTKVTSDKDWLSSFAVWNATADERTHVFINSRIDSVASCLAALTGDTSGEGVMGTSSSGQATSTGIGQCGLDVTGIRDAMRELWRIASDPRYTVLPVCACVCVCVYVCVCVCVGRGCDLTLSPRSRYHDHILKTAAVPLLVAVASPDLGTRAAALGTVWMMSVAGRLHDLLQVCLPASVRTHTVLLSHTAPPNDFPLLCEVLEVGIRCLWDEYRCMTAMQQRPARAESRAAAVRAHDEAATKASEAGGASDKQQAQQQKNKNKKSSSAVAVTTTDVARVQLDIRRYQEAAAGVVSLLAAFRRDVPTTDGGSDDGDSTDSEESADGRSRRSGRNKPAVEHLVDTVLIVNDGVEGSERLPRTEPSILRQLLSRVFTWDVDAVERQYSDFEQQLQALCAGAIGSCTAASQSSSALTTRGGRGHANDGCLHNLCELLRLPHNCLQAFTKSMQPQRSASTPKDVMKSMRSHLWLNKVKRIGTQASIMPSHRGSSKRANNARSRQGSTRHMLARDDSQGHLGASSRSLRRDAPNGQLNAKDTIRAAGVVSVLSMGKSRFQAALLKAAREKRLADRKARELEAKESLHALLSGKEQVRLEDDDGQGEWCVV